MLEVCEDIEEDRRGLASLDVVVFRVFEGGGGWMVKGFRFVCCCEEESVAAGVALLGIAVLCRCCRGVGGSIPFYL